MPGRVRVVSGGGGGSRAVTLGLLLAVLVALVVGLAIGRLTAPTSHSGSTRTVPVASGPGPTRTENGVPVGYTDTKQGAVAALLNYSVVLSDPRVLLNAKRRAQVLAIVATSRYASTFQGAGAAALSAARSGPIGKGILSGAQTVYLSAPIAYRVQSYTPSTAVVAGWGVSVVGNDQGVAPQATWGSTVTTAQWVNGDWRIDSVTSSDGPTPALATGQQPSTATAFLGALSGMQEPRHEP